MARDVAVQMCDTLEGKAYTGVVNVSYMAVANEVPSLVLSCRLLFRLGLVCIINS